MILCDREIAELCRGDRPLIDPFVAEQRRDGGPSYGLSSYGYDVRLGDGFKRMEPGLSVVDARQIHGLGWIGWEASGVILKAGAFVLAHSIETLSLPDDIFGTCYGKSTLARLGIHVLVTPLEPGWSGQITLEIVNHSPRDVALWAGDGICQIRFDRGSRPDVTYADRAGRYMGQRGVVVPS